MQRDNLKLWFPCHDCATDLQSIYVSSPHTNLILTSLMRIYRERDFFATCQVALMKMMLLTTINTVDNEEQYG